MKEIIAIIQQALDGKFTGSIQFNFFKGGVTNIVRTESIKLNN